MSSRDHWSVSAGHRLGCGGVSAFILAAGVVAWAWSVLLILKRVRAGELVTTGPYALVKHPLYTSVALLVLPWLSRDQTAMLASWPSRLGAASSSNHIPPSAR